MLGGANYFLHINSNSECLPYLWTMALTQAGRTAKQKAKKNKS